MKPRRKVDLVTSKVRVENYRKAKETDLISNTSTSCPATFLAATADYTNYKKSPKTRNKYKFKNKHENH